MAYSAVKMGLSHSLLCTCRVVQSSARKIRDVGSFASQTVGALALPLLLLSSPLSAQSNPPDPNAGIQMWSTSEFGIDLATSGVNIQIPGRSKAGAIPFSSNFFGTNQVFASSGGGVAGLTVTNPPLLSYFDSTSVTYYSEFLVEGATCSGGTGTYNQLGNFVVSDLTGAYHPLPSSFTWKISTTPGCGTTPGPTVTTDGSGYTLVPLGPTNNLAYVYDRNGNKWTAGTVTDPDKNSISTSNGSSGYGTVTDTLGEPVMTANLPGPTSYSYATSSGTAYYTYGTSPYYLKSNFACTNWADFGSPYSFSLLTSLTRPDEAEYTFTYEPTPNGNGFTNNGTYVT